jgi:hypothetical protein
MARALCEARGIEHTPRSAVINDRSSSEVHSLNMSEVEGYNYENGFGVAGSGSTMCSDK